VRQAGNLPHGFETMLLCLDHFGVRRGIALVFLILDLPAQKRKYQSGDPSPHSKTVLIEQNRV